MQKEIRDELPMANNVWGNNIFSLQIVLAHFVNLNVSYNQFLILPFHLMFHMMSSLEWSSSNGCIIAHYVNESWLP